MKVLTLTVVIPGECRNCGAAPAADDIVFVTHLRAFYHDDADNQNRPCGPVGFTGAGIESLRAEIDRLRALAAP